VSSSGRFFDRVMPLGVLRYQRSIDGLETVVGLGHPGDELLQTRNVTRQDSSSKRVMGDSLVAAVCRARRTTMNSPVQVAVCGARRTATGSPARPITSAGATSRPQPTIASPPG